MDIEVREIEHTANEIQMGHALHFRRLETCDCLSATANMGGFTTLSALVRDLYPGRHAHVSHATEACNLRGETVVVADLAPKLFLVPKTRVDDAKETGFLIDDLLNAIEAAKGTILHFTHYAFMPALSMTAEVTEVLRALRSAPASRSLKKIVIDADTRVAGQFCAILKEQSTP